ncbi:hypothetical protein C2G38_2232948 [Gigaspora rosea]|uniref:Uncharacterized protein n=1 Tax=Gigaspora rosea TaxID=44941 RepID=A0A397TTN3_9GLOM|nr:hypothetical protein C2G38_2232948 [Gigaspora rosea]
MELERNAFVTTLSKFTFLRMRPKNLISTGVDQTVVLDLFNARKRTRPHPVDNGARRSSSTSKRSFSSRPTSQNSPGVKVITNDDPSFKFRYPLLFGFHDVIMNGEDLEVRARVLGCNMSSSSLPIFGVLRSRSDVSKFSNHEDMSVWLSTAMIQALRHRFIDATKQFSEQSNGFVSEVDLNTRSMIEEHYSEPEHTTTMAPDEQRAKEFK